MIVFRQINEEIPDEWVAGMHWYVEHHDDDWTLPYPTGMAFVLATPDEKMVIIEYLHVQERYRRCGVATILLGAIKEKWPNAKLTEAVTEDGEKFLAAFRKTHGECWDAYEAKVEATLKGT